MNNLYNDILQIILNYCKHKTTAHLVCKKWNNILINNYSKYKYKYKLYASEFTCNRKMILWAINNNLILNDTVTQHIALCGKLKLLKWLVLNKYKLNYKNSYHTIKAAAKGGHINIIEYLLDNGVEQTGEILFGAAETGQLNVIKWYINKYGPLFDYFYENIIYTIIKNNQIKLLHWFHDNNYPKLSKITTYAVIYNNIELLEWLYNHKYPLSNMAYYYCSISGNMNIMKWLINHNCPFYENITGVAASHYHFDIVKFLYDNGHKLEKSVAVYAAKNGNMDILEWYYEKCKELSSEICSNAIKNGNFEILKWAINNGCKTNNETYDTVINNNNIEILEWLLKNDKTDKKFNISINLEILRKIIKNNCYYCIKK